MTTPIHPATCPTCRKVAAVVDRRMSPFCTERCQQIDLGRWLAEEYRIPEPISDVSGGGIEGLIAAGEAEAGD